MSWWLSGGINSGDCLAAWQGVGASSQSDSYVNLANPGTYNLTQGAAYPDWSAVNGWHTATPSWGSDYTKHLDTGIVVPSGTPTYTAIGRFQTDATTAGHYVLGSGDSIYAGSNEFALYTYSWGNGGFINGNVYDPGVDYAGDADGTMAVAGLKCFRNGSLLTTMSSTNLNSGTRSIVLWNTRVSDGSVARGLLGKLYAAAIYSVTLTNEQISALHTAMMALPEASKIPVFMNQYRQRGA